MMPKLCVLGAGSWATALTKIFSGSGISVHWWFHREDDARHFHEFRHNPRYLSDIDFSGKDVQAFSNVSQALQGADWVLVAIPSAFVASVLKSIPKEELQGKILISSIKGILPEELVLVTDFVANAFDIPQTDMAVIGGPCHAEEVALEKQSYLTIGSPNEQLAIQIQQIMSSRYISAVVSSDMEGIEWAAILKNVYAIACGLCHGVGYGDNFQAVLVSNAMQEMNRFLKTLSGRDRDPLASAYLGDLLVTAYSTFSRNRTFGNMVGRGYGIKAAQLELGMVAEGYYAICGLHELRGKLGISLPIAEAVYEIMYEQAPVKETLARLKGILS
jgi:glycerol-3-phosphate dehydrogenase (NAD(P)+)